MVRRLRFDSPISPAVLKAVGNILALFASDLLACILMRKLSLTHNPVVKVARLADTSH